MGSSISAQKLAAASCRQWERQGILTKEGGGEVGFCFKVGAERRKLGGGRQSVEQQSRLQLERQGQQTCNSWRQQALQVGSGVGSRQAGGWGLGAGGEWDVAVLVQAFLAVTRGFELRVRSVAVVCFNASF